MAQRQTKISDEAQNALDNGEYQWALELADMLIALDANNTQAKNIKAAAADQLAKFQVASNDYYFYKTVAGELRNEIDVNPSTPNRVTSEQLQATPMLSLIHI